MTRAPKNSKCFLRCVNGDRRLLFGIKRANVVEAENVVGVGVCVENRVEMSNASAQGLLAEVRGSVDDDVAAIVREQHRGARALVVQIGGVADIALAGESRNAHRSARAQYGDKQPARVRNGLGISRGHEATARLWHLRAWIWRRPWRSPYKRVLGCRGLR